jgi:hypothetical protein
MHAIRPLFFPRVVLLVVLLAAAAPPSAPAALAQSTGPFFAARLPYDQGDPSVSITGPDTTRVATGDLDNDGDIDIVTRSYFAVGLENSGEGRIRSYLNDGAGAFSPGASFAFSATQLISRTLALGDMNGDGALDIVISNQSLDDSNSGTFSIFRNDGRGGFGAQQRITVPTGSAEALVLADLNGDALLDILGSRGLIRWNDPAQSFAQQLQLPVASILSAPVAAGDMNGDGLLDVVTGDFQVYRNQRAGGATSFVAAEKIGREIAFFNLLLGDLDGDGLLDVVSDLDRVYLNRGAQPFEERFVFGMLARENIRDLSLGDLDGDGDLDLVVANTRDQSLVHLNFGDGQLGFGRAFGFRTLNTAVALADLDGDRALDIVGGGQLANFAYVNDMAELLLARSASSRLVGELFQSLALGDLDDDGDLDAVVSTARSTFVDGVQGPDDERMRVYLNNGQGSFSMTQELLPRDQLRIVKLALGDMDGDGDLDIVSGSYQIYRNDGGGSFDGGQTFRADLRSSSALALGDLDGDGDLDVVASNGRTSGLDNSPDEPGTFFLNDGKGNLAAGQPFSPSVDIDGMALGDLDNDSDLDIIASFEENTWLIRNDGGDGFGEPQPFGPAAANTVVLALGDIDGDGDLDLVGDVFRRGVTIFRNDGNGSFAQSQAFAGGDEPVKELALGDLDGDGDLDLAVAVTRFYGAPSLLYRNDGGGRFERAQELAFDDTAPWALAVGDLDADGLADLAAVQNTFGSVREGELGVVQARVARGDALPNNPPLVRLDHPGPTPPATGYASPAILNSPLISLTYTLSDVESDPIRELRAFYSLNGGGQWLPALPASGTITANLAAAPDGTTHVFRWDTFASGLFGQSDNVVFRIEAYQGSLPVSNTVAGPFQLPYAAAQSMPFRVRGTQVQVVDSQGQPQPDALVYRLPSGRALGGLAIGNDRPFVTDAQGFLDGRGTLAPGDRLLALAPLTATASYTLYHTSAAPTATGLDAFAVASAGVQTLVVSETNPLLLFNVDVTLEWDASNDPVYLQQLRFDLQRASEYLYDFSDGQAALGQVTVRQNGERRGDAEVVVRASNRLRPYAAQGGVVLTPTRDLARPEIEYDSGQIVMGATWNRYGEPGQNLGEDWPVTLAHELGHYLFFLDDVYLGLDDEGLLIAVDSCTRSAMGDPYTLLESTEFIADEVFWQANCARSLTNRTLGRTEWATIQLYYPWLRAPANVNPGPSTMPFDLTEVTILPPQDSTPTLSDPTFYLDYPGGAISSSEARAFLIHGDTLTDIGSPVGGQNRAQVRGARAGDRLCVFDRPRQSFGCETIALGDDRLSLRRDPSWDPLLLLNPVTTSTLALRVEGLPAGLPLQARLYPAEGTAAPTVTLTAAGGIYSGVIQLDEPALEGALRLWVDEPESELDPRRETIVDYAIGGNPGRHRRSQGGERGGGGRHRRSQAPVVSSDGQLIFYTANPVIFEAGDLFSVQTMAGLPELPTGKTVIGRGYNLVASQGTPVISGSVSIQYLASDVQLAGADEEELTLHYFDGANWRALETLRDPYYNLVSARSQGPGIYALLAGVSAPLITSLSPASATSAQSSTLEIAGGPFLAPLQLALVRASAAYTLPLTAVTSTTVRAVLPAGLPPGEYQLRVLNGDGGTSLAPVAFALYAPSRARFYDFFESGTSRWQLSGEWGIVELPGGGRAISDSPEGNYRHASTRELSRTTAISSQPFSLDGLNAPLLQFRHDYVLARLGSSEDLARVEISTDDGASWQLLKSYSGGGPYGLVARQALDSEWQDVNWKYETIDLSGYAGTLRLRFSLTVDGSVSDKGWLLDDVRVFSPDDLGARYLPLISR